MTIFKVLNVGQGDSIVINPPGSCKLSDETILVDLGDGGYDITRDIAPNKKIHIFITHHDMDHVGGMQYIIRSMDRISEITVPFYQNEIILIAKAILNLKGIRKAKDCEELIRTLERTVNEHRFLMDLSEDRGNELHFTYAFEGRSWCSHIKCLNPPIVAETCDCVEEMDDSEIGVLMEELFSAEFAGALQRYFQTGDNVMYEIGDNLFQDWMRVRDYEIPYDASKREFVFDFILANLSGIREFNRTGKRKYLLKIYQNYVKCSHDVCTVLKVEFGKKGAVLLAADASKKVFRRLIREGKDISAYYIKMPHHGSKNNMSRRILEAIDPKVAIISHKNGRFGKAKDTHPNQKVLDLLKEKEIKVLITNDVVKNDVTIMKKQNHSTDPNGYIEIQ